MGWADRARRPAMRGCLFTLLLGAVAIALLVTVGLPQVDAGL